MFMARVVGQVWAAAKWPELEGLRFLLVRPYELGDLRAGAVPSPDAAVVAADVLGAGPGEDVIVAYGHAARVGVEPDLAAGERPHRPIDAAVVAIVDRWDVEGA
jgi:microcompartment protein CcmK/EutM